MQKHKAFSCTPSISAMHWYYKSEGCPLSLSQCHQFKVSFKKVENLNKHVRFHTDQGQAPSDRLKCKLQACMISNCSIQFQTSQINLQNMLLMFVILISKLNILHLTLQLSFKKCCLLMLDMFEGQDLKNIRTEVRFILQFVTGRDQLLHTCKRNRTKIVL